MGPLFVGLAWLVGFTVLVAQLGWGSAALIGFGYLLGGAASAAVLHKIGERDPCTIGDCYSGDDGLDLLLIVLWPVTLPCIAVYSGVKRLG